MINIVIKRVSNYYVHYLNFDGPILLSKLAFFLLYFDAISHTSCFYHKSINTATKIHLLF